MDNWHEDLLDLLLTPNTSDGEEVLHRIVVAARKLDFEHVAYGFQAAYPLTHPPIIVFTNCPPAWQRRYAEAGYVRIDPTVAHARRSTTPLLWRDEVFVSAPTLWAEAQEHGLRVGWSQSCLSEVGSLGMLVLWRNQTPLSADELAAHEPQMRWLVQVAHTAFNKLLVQQSASRLHALTPREREVLQWTADGKSAQDIADILTLSKSAVDFHIKNAMHKLQTSNKTAAVARAALLGMLH